MNYGTDAQRQIKHTNNFEILLQILCIVYALF